ncbi:MAG: multidrug ABC transporter permease, partial [Desulfobacterales bacterium CG23_combo_of_CG06-09_8_20_14_all_51_8]
FGDTHNEEALIRAVAAAAVYDTIRNFPNGFDTIIGEKGVMLSGGQKQRLVLARALIHDPKILLLDDPVGQVDTQTAAAIVRTIRDLARDRTILISSHRIAALQYADTILVLSAGRIAAEGTHATLLVKSDYYARSYEIQRAEQLESEENPHQ